MSAQKLDELQEDIYEPEFVRRLFNSMSDSYERMNFITSFGFSIIWRKQFIARLGTDDQPIKVLDLLSGLGENWSTLKKHFPNASFTALDFSDVMCNQSRNKSLRLFGNRFSVTQQDVLCNKLPSNEFDIIACAFGLKNFNEHQLAALAKTLNRILKKNGKFSFIEISKPNNQLLLFFYRFYLKYCIPFLGKIFLGNPNDYKMLWEYTDRFQNAKQVHDIFKEQKLHVTYHSYFFGCATGMSGYKQD